MSKILKLFLVCFFSLVPLPTDSNTLFYVNVVFIDNRCFYEYMTYRDLMKLIKDYESNKFYQSIFISRSL